MSLFSYFLDKKIQIKMKLVQKFVSEISETLFIHCLVSNIFETIICFNKKVILFLIVNLNITEEKRNIKYAKCNKNLKKKIIIP